MCQLGPPRSVYPPGCPGEGLFGHIPPDALLPYLSYLSIEYMRVNVCFPVYFCHLQDRTGHPEQVDTEVFIIPPGVAQ